MLFDVKGPKRIDALSGSTSAVHVDPPTRFDPTGVSPIVKPNGTAAGPAPPQLPDIPVLISSR